jgi:translation initiation factor 3 subunit B
MTFSPCHNDNENPKAPKSIIVWDVRTGKSRRGFASMDGVPWPEFRWSHDDKYFARMTNEGINVYESATMKLLGKQGFKCPGIRDFLWSPTDNVISCWFPESDGGNNPARVMLVQVPSRKEIVSKSLFNVSDCRMHWQGAGDYLCVKVDRHTKTKKSTYTNFELFKIRSKNVPVEVLEHKDTILAFAWEPNGNRFAIIHSSNPNQKLDVTFYEMRTDGGVRPLKTLEKRQASHLFWAPQGGFILLAGLRSSDGGHLEFYNVNDLETMATQDHFGCSHIVWDPTGRFVATSISAWAQQQMENGYNIWSFQGKLIHKVLKDRFYQFSWRPRPPTLLPKEKEEYIKQHLKEYSARFLREEHDEKQKALKELQEKRDSVLSEFAAWTNSFREEYAASREFRRELWGGAASDEDSGWEEYEETVEELISQNLEYF